MSKRRPSKRRKSAGTLLYQAAKGLQGELRKMKRREERLAKSLKFVHSLMFSRGIELGSSQYFEARQSIVDALKYTGRTPQ